MPTIFSQSPEFRHVSVGAPRGPVTFKADAAHGDCTDPSKIRYLFVNGMETPFNRASEQAAAIAKRLDACVMLKHNPAKLETGIDVVQKNPKLPVISSISLQVASILSATLSVLPGVRLQPRAFETGLINSIRAYAHAEIQAGRNAHVISFSLGNIYTYLALASMCAAHTKYISWISIGSPIHAHDFKSELGLQDVTMINAIGDSVSTLGGSINFWKFLEGVTHNSHDFLKTYLPRIADEVYKKPDIFTLSTPKVKMCYKTIFYDTSKSPPGTLIIYDGLESHHEYIPCERA